MNFLLRTDSYKFTHWKQYPPNTTAIYSYLESRGGMFPATVFFGLQYYLKAYVQGPVFTEQDIAQADEFCRQHFGRDLFNRYGWTRLLQKHGGCLPVRIRAVPEGSVVSNLNVLATIENTDPDFPWLTNYLETLLLKVWYPTTVATLSREIKKIIKGFLVRTGDPALLPFKLHDFGYRGVSSEETAAIGGAAHLVNFMGTDTVAGIILLQDYYHTKSMPGFSIPASEHSTITAWGKEHELDAYRNMLTAYPEGLDYPLPPHPLGKAGRKAAEGMNALGWHWWPGTNAIPSQKFKELSQCARWGTCEWGCPESSKASSDIAFWPHALRSGATLVTGARVRTIETQRDGRATGALWIDREGAEHRQRAHAVAVCANGIGTPRLLLLSASAQHPDGLANSSGLVGKNLMLHPNCSVTGFYGEDLESWRGPAGQLIHSMEFYETRAEHDFVRGAKLHALPTPGPLNAVEVHRALPYDQL